jgi:hypothetical protein
MDIGNKTASERGAQEMPQTNNHHSEDLRRI